MSRIYKKIKVLSLIVLSIVLFVNMTQFSFAMDESSLRTQIVGISTMEELLDWYPSKGEEAPLAMLTTNLVIDKHMELSSTTGYRCINGGLFSISIVDGGSLRVDNPKNIEIMGQEALFIVESGGELDLSAGFFDVTDGKALITVKKGGVYKTGEDAKLGATGDDLIIDENDPEGAPIDPPVEPPIDPEEPTGTPIVKIWEEDAYFAYPLGEAPNNPTYPTTAGVITEKGTFSVPVHWDTTTVEFDTAGIYQCIGTFTKEELAEQSLINPHGLTTSMTIEIYKKAPLDFVKVEVTDDGFGNYIAKMIFPRLPEDEIESIYIDRSNDGETWEECGDFKHRIIDVGRKSYILYKYSENVQPAFLRGRIAGSDYAGTTNVLDLGNLDGAEPEDDGSSGGNRGGGTQREEERDKEISEDIMAVERELTLEEEEAMDSLIALQGEKNHQNEEASLFSTRENLTHKTSIRGKSGLENGSTTIGNNTQGKTVEMVSANLHEAIQKGSREVQILKSGEKDSLEKGILLKAMLAILGATLVFAVTKPMMKKR